MEHEIVLCETCGKDKNEYDKNALCKKNHNWRLQWRKDKKKNLLFLQRKSKGTSETHFKRLDKLNKEPPEEYAKRKRNKHKWWHKKNPGGFWS